MTGRFRDTAAVGAWVWYPFCTMIAFYPSCESGSHIPRLILRMHRADVNPAMTEIITTAVQDRQGYYGDPVIPVKSMAFRVFTT